ncbi:cobalt-precorrin-3B C(17)-methyltransferase [Clostridiales bacterium PH28_bin88]|nr:cobalt-precorrin-3B C(17)-methyltransferase [Clostridiales bacterium PH28_bin88]
MTFRAHRALREAEVVVGYHTYLQLLGDLLAGKEVIGSGMTREQERCRSAVDLALAGKRVAVVSSGDPGVYGMAGVVLEIVHHLGVAEELDLEVIPGVTAATAAAASLGAPLMHDFATISLSDLLTPWEVIRRRVELAAQADYVLAIYNPKSKKRVRQVLEVQELVLRYRVPDTPVGLVRNASRQGEEVTFSTLARFTELPIDMFSLVIVGNSGTRVLGQHLVTPRGYVW